MSENKVPVSEEMQPRERRLRENHIPMGGIFLVFIGTVLLLQSLEILPWALWNTLWRFWPVLLIITGLGILLRRYNVWLVSALIMVLLFACLALAVWRQDWHQNRPLPTPAKGNFSIESPSLYLPVAHDQR